MDDLISVVQGLFGDYAALILGGIFATLIGVKKVAKYGFTSQYEKGFMTKEDIATAQLVDWGFVVVAFGISFLSMSYQVNAVVFVIAFGIFCVSALTIAFTWIFVKKRSLRDKLLAGATISGGGSLCILCLYGEQTIVNRIIICFLVAGVAGIILFSELSSQYNRFVAKSSVELDGKKYYIFYALDEKVLVASDVADMTKSKERFLLPIEKVMENSMKVEEIQENQKEDKKCKDICLEDWEKENVFDSNRMKLYIGIIIAEVLCVCGALLFKWNWPIGTGMNNFDLWGLMGVQASIAFLSMTAFQVISEDFDKDILGISYKKIFFHRGFFVFNVSDCIIIQLLLTVTTGVGVVSGSVPFASNVRGVLSVVLAVNFMLTLAASCWLMYLLLVARYKISIIYGIIYRAVKKDEKIKNKIQFYRVMRAEQKEHDPYLYLKLRLIYLACDGKEEACGKKMRMLVENDDRKITDYVREIAQQNIILANSAEEDIKAKRIVFGKTCC